MAYSVIPCLLAFASAWTCDEVYELQDCCSATTSPTYAEHDPHFEGCSAFKDYDCKRGIAELEKTDVTQTEVNPWIGQHCYDKIKARRLNEEKKSMEERSVAAQLTDLQLAESVDEFEAVIQGKGGPPACNSCNGPCWADFHNRCTNRPGSGGTGGGGCRRLLDSLEQQGDESNEGFVARRRLVESDCNRRAHLRRLQETSPSGGLANDSEDINVATQLHETTDLLSHMIAELDMEDMDKLVTDLTLDEELDTSEAGRRRRRRRHSHCPHNHNPHGHYSYYTSCTVGTWSGWSGPSCSSVCDGKRSVTHTRTRSISRPQYCSVCGSHTTVEYKTLRAPCCAPKQNCVLSSWTGWTGCTSTCIGGSQRRTRSVVTPASGNPIMGIGCSPEREQNQQCNLGVPCAVPCIQSTWSYTAWSACSRGCGGGHQYRTKLVTQAAQHGGACDQTKYWRDCNTHSCCSPCQLGSWSGYGACHGSCGSGTKYQTRSAIQASPANCDGSRYTCTASRGAWCPLPACPTPEPTKYPTPLPTKYPTPSPTNHICLTDQHNCATTAGGVCYAPNAADYANAKTHHDLLIKGEDDHALDSTEWLIPEFSETLNHDTSIVGMNTQHNENSQTVHAYKCGCADGYSCVAGCSPPFTGHTCEMTKYPTPFPTAYPTAIPTAAPTYNTCTSEEYITHAPIPLFIGTPRYDPEVKCALYTVCNIPPAGMPTAEYTADHQYVSVAPTEYSDLECKNYSPTCEEQTPAKPAPVCPAGWVLTDGVQTKENWCSRGKTVNHGVICRKADGSGHWQPPTGCIKHPTGAPYSTYPDGRVCKVGCVCDEGYMPTNGRYANGREPFYNPAMPGTTPTLTWRGNRCGNWDYGVVCKKTPESGLPAGASRWLAPLGCSVVGPEKECNQNIMSGKAIHHAPGALARDSNGQRLVPWPYLSNGCNSRGSCTQDECAQACKRLTACRGWTYGNGGRCYLLGQEHMRYVATAASNGAFNSAVCAIPSNADLRANNLKPQTINANGDICRATCDLFEARPPTDDSDRKCANLRVCGAGFFERRAATSTRDRLCRAIRECDWTTQYERRSPTENSDRVCRPIGAECDLAVEYEHQTPTRTRRRICRPQRVCQADEYERGFNRFGKRICRRIRECYRQGDLYPADMVYRPNSRFYDPLNPTQLDHRAGLQRPIQWELLAPTATTNRVCKNVLKCNPNRQDKIGVDGDVNGDGVNDAYCVLKSRSFALEEVPTRIGRPGVYCAGTCGACGAECSCGQVSGVATHFYAQDPTGQRFHSGYRTCPAGTVQPTSGCVERCVPDKECNQNIMSGKAIHHASGALAADPRLWPHLSNGCNSPGSCTQDECAAACKSLEACTGWTYGNGGRCYLLAQEHMEHVETAASNGAFNSAVCTNIPDPHARSPIAHEASPTQVARRDVYCAGTCGACGAREAGGALSCRCGTYAGVLQHFFAMAQPAGPRVHTGYRSCPPGYEQPSTTCAESCVPIPSSRRLSEGATNVDIVPVSPRIEGPITCAQSEIKNYGYCEEHQYQESGDVCAASDANAPRCNERTQCDATEDWFEVSPATNTTDAECKPVTVCTQVEFEVQAPTPKSDRKCAPFVPCLATEYAILPANTTEEENVDTNTTDISTFSPLCTLLTVCDTGDATEDAPGATATQFIRDRASLNSDRNCSLLTVCADGEFEALSPTKYSDRTCESKMVCNEESFMSNAGKADAACAPLSHCKSDEYEHIKATETSDRVCDTVKQCDVSEYEAAGATLVSNKVCLPVSRCPSPMYVITAATKYTDTVCGNSQSPTPTPTSTPTKSPTTYPTPSPTYHICDTDQHSCDSTPHGKCYKFTAGIWNGRSYDNSKFHYGAGHGGTDARGIEHADDADVSQIDITEWSVPVTHTDDGTKSIDHVFKCGCEVGYNCVSGCEPPFANHVCQKTLAPTPYPTAVPTLSPTQHPTPNPTTHPTSQPTPAPTPFCPITCEVDTGSDPESKFKSNLGELAGCDLLSDGTLNPVFGSTHQNCNWKNKHSHRIVSTHHTVEINLHDSYRKHRCYSVKEAGTRTCVCECIDSPDFAGYDRFQSGTVQGNKAGTNKHRGPIADQEVFFATMSEFDAVTDDGKSVFSQADADGATPLN